MSASYKLVLLILFLCMLLPSYSQNPKYKSQSDKAEEKEKRNPHSHINIHFLGLSFTAKQAIFENNTNWNYGAELGFGFIFSKAFGSSALIENAFFCAFLDYSKDYKWNVELGPRISIAVTADQLADGSDAGLLYGLSAGVFVDIGKIKLGTRFSVNNYDYYDFLTAQELIILRISPGSQKRKKLN
ncbi:MAG: hypothetical protein KDD41_07235 [Flavobacteriales bacterium]|nr:hypothetical protein [Flavobacteriales bacterium]